MSALVEEVRKKKWTTLEEAIAVTYRLADALEAAERERDEALALTESCSTLKEMAAACIEGADLKRRLVDAERRAGKAEYWKGEFCKFQSRAIKAETDMNAIRAHLPALELARETFKEHNCEWAFNSLYEVVRSLEGE